MTSSTPATESSGGFFSTLGGILGNLGTTAAQTYATVETAKLTEKANASLRPSNPTQPSGATSAAVPWYKQKWVIPTAIGAGLLVLVLIVTGRRK